MYPDLRAYIEQKVQLSQTDWESIYKAFQPLNFEARELILESGKVCQNLYFLRSGLVRFYFFDEMGNEVSKFFTFPPQLFTAQSSFGDQLPAIENIEALEASQVLALSFKANEKLFQQVPKWSRFILDIVREVQSGTERIMLAQKSQTAEQRYRKFLQVGSHIIQRVPLKYLASYLGIAPESLSRIRKKIQLENRT